MVKKNGLLFNTFILTLGTVVPKALMLLMLPLYTFFLSKSDYGIYDLAITIINLLIPLITLQIPSGVFRMLLNNSDHKKIISSANFILIISMIISTIILLLATTNIDGDIKYLFILYMMLNLIFQYLLEICRGLNFNKKYAISCIINAFLMTILSLIFLVIFQLQIYGLLFAIIVAQLIVDIYLLISIKFKYYIATNDIDKKYMKELVKYSVPLIPNSLSWWIVNVSDRLIISLFLGIESSAVYAISNKIPSVYSLFYNAFNLSWQENASINYSHGNVDEYYSIIFDNLFKFLLSGLTLLISILPFVFKILVSNEYSLAYYQMPILCVSLLFSSVATFFGGIYVAKKDTKKLGISTIIAAAINILINICLIRYIGLYAASISTLLSYIIICIYRYVDIRKTIKIKIEFNKYKKIGVSLFPIICIFYLENTYLNIFGFLFSLILFITLNKNLIKKLTKRGVKNEK